MENKTGKVFNKINTFKIALYFTLGVGVMTLFPSCVKNVKCEDATTHAHLYVDEQTGLSKYIVSEKETYKSGGVKLTRTEDKITVNEQEQKIIDFMVKNGLYAVSGNKDELAKYLDGKQYIEYAFNYKSSQTSLGVGVVYSGGVGVAPTATYSKSTLVGWTKDTSLTKYNGNDVAFTGQKRLVTPVYHAYKIVENKKGKLELVVSEGFKSLAEIPDGYKFIKIGDYKEETYDYNYYHIDNFEKSVDEQELVK